MKLSKQIFGWMMYDFANSAFTTIIVTVVYSVYFMNVVVGGDVTNGEMLWGLAVGISMTLVALTAPILGAVADYSRSKKSSSFSIPISPSSLPRCCILWARGKSPKA